MPSPLPFQLSVITDEIHTDLEPAIAVARDLGLSIVELNNVWGKNVADLAPDELERVRAVLETAGMRVVAVGPPCFKPVLLGDVTTETIGADPAFLEHMATLRRAIAAAQVLRAPFVRVFSFRRQPMQGLGNPSPRLPRGGPIPDEILPRIVAGLRIACEAAAAGGVTLALENVRSCWGNSGVNTGRILDAVDSPHLKAIWDPGNDYVSGGVPYPEGYDAVKRHMAHIHLKDARVLDHATGRTAWEAVGAGEANLAAQLAALLHDGYSSVISLETHWRAPDHDAEWSTRRSMEGLQRILAELRTLS